MQQILELVQKSGFIVSSTEWDKLITLDFGLGDFQSEGASIIDVFLSEKLRITLLILLPQQTLPEHRHPAYQNIDGKEETLRVLYGKTKVYVEGVENNQHIQFPKNKSDYYTARHEVILNSSEQFTILPGVRHWFQAGSEGSVLLEFQNRVDETRNIFSDPNCTLCKLN